MVQVITLTSLLRTSATGTSRPGSRSSIATDFKPKPQEIKDGFFVAEVGEPYIKPKEGDFTTHHFELYYDPETQLFVGGKLHFVYMELVHKDNYPIMWGVYDIHTEIYPASGRPPWIIVGKQTTTATTSLTTTTTAHCL